MLIRVNQKPKCLPFTHSFPFTLQKIHSAPTAACSSGFQKKNLAVSLLGGGFPPTPSSPPHTAPKNHPHTPLAPLLPRLYEAKVGALNMPFANPGHQHEYETFRKHPLPQDMILIPGVIDNMSKHLEHPEVVAERIIRAVDMVGDRARVIAGGDCGFAVFTDYALVTEDICWAKFRAVREGADIASRRLWG